MTAKTNEKMECLKKVVSFMEQKKYKEACCELSCGFVWSDSKEGKVFWNTITDRLADA